MQTVGLKGGLGIFTVRKYTKFEKARIIGARALQISMGAPVLVEVPKHLKSSVEIALYEFEKGVCPITVLRELPGES
ncbi:MAG: DNA-directed RNA polymerase subunit K [Hadesarchaea archaeon]|nr:MAG: DNA-directed RNA polymerase subunit K [Hadesarchaea archaeon]TDA35649.1 MAG: DNA-directed RNA polymerase subunit K [Hadesarchaea archaeon]